MLAAIGLILIMKQLPHAVGYDADAEADLSFLEDDSHTRLSFLWDAFRSFSTGAVIVSVVSLAIMLLWDTPYIKEASLPFDRARSAGRGAVWHRL